LESLVEGQTLWIEDEPAEPSGIHLPAVGSADSGDNLEYETKAVEDRSG